MKKILPSILSADFTHLANEIHDVEKGGADLLHLDIMDGKFVPNITIGPAQVAQIKKVSSLELDVHLMIDNPQQYIDEFSSAGSNFISFHIEANGKPQDTIAQIHKNGVKAGLSLRPQTSISELSPFLKNLDMVLVMSVNPGFGGQKFMPESLPRIKELKDLCKKHNPNLIIAVDGGVNLNNIKSLSNAGVNFFVAGNTIFKEKNRADIINKLKKAINEK